MDQRLNRFKNLQASIYFGDDYQPRNEAERKEVLDFISPYAESIMVAILQAERKFQNYACENPIARQCNNFAPVNMTNLIAQELSGLSGFCLNNFTRGNPEVVIGEYKFWIKKVDTNLQPKFNSTKSTISRVNQLSQDEEDQLPILILGYQLSDDQRVSNVHLIYRRGVNMIWAPINIGDLGAQKQEYINETLDSNHIEEVPMKVKGGRQVSQVG